MKVNLFHLKLIAFASLTLFTLSISGLITNSVLVFIFQLLGLSLIHISCLYSALLSRRQFTKEEICALSERHEVCPFELQLDLSLWCDLIIGDYNYLFDPTARLQRYFGELQNSGKKEPYVYLIDEAHNLPDRAREMYTARIQKKPFLELMRLLKGSERKTVKTVSYTHLFW